MFSLGVMPLYLIRNTPTPDLLVVLMFKVNFPFGITTLVDTDIVCGDNPCCPSMSDITLDIPTPQFIHEDELSLLDIQRNMSINNSLYVVVHSASNYIPYEQLKNEFVCTFVLGDVMTCLYM